MSQRPVLRFASRGWRDLPGPSTRVRGSGRLPYNPDRPLSLPGDRRPRRRPQFRTDLLARLIVPVLLLGGLGVGVFFGVSAILDDDEPALGAAPTDSTATDVTPATGAATDAAAIDTTSPADASAPAAGADSASPINADQSAATVTPATDATTDDATADTTADAGVEALGFGSAAGVVTEAQLQGAPDLIERAGATPIPSGTAGLTIADGSLYDATDATAALSSVWPAGTLLEITRLPGGPLLTDDDASELIGKSVQVLVVANGEFPTELQLSPAAYRLIARDFEPIIALRVAAIAAPE